ncbi:hypothetical protein B7494_g3917 [Chlorociboria aeruginascens]|nr:hypothetical protein B7494_g3917 [Chlorociboria aeruginascens]
MNRTTVLRQILLAPPTLRASIFSPIVRHPPTTRRYAGVQSITQPSFWSNLVPKPLRKTARAAKKPKSREWNPATFFICIFLLIGSMSIQMIALRNEYATFSRRADAKIGLLREVMEKIRNGEDIDVEGLLGTGNAKKEREWEEVLQEIELEDQAWEKSQTPKPTQNPKLSAGDTSENPSKMETVQNSKSERSNAPRGFY